MSGTLNKDAFFNLPSPEVQSTAPDLVSLNDMVRPYRVNMHRRTGNCLHFFLRCIGSSEKGLIKFRAELGFEP